MGIHTVTLGPVVGPWVNKTRGYLQPLVKAHPDGMRIALLLFFFPYLASGTGLDFLVDWLNGLGISYVPPMPRQGTCRDCSKSTLVSAASQGEHFNFQARARSARAQRACARRALGLLLADGTPTVGGGKTF